MYASAVTKRRFKTQTAARQAVANRIEYVWCIITVIEYSSLLQIDARCDKHTHEMCWRAYAANVCVFVCVCVCCITHNLRVSRPNPVVREGNAVDLGRARVSTMWMRDAGAVDYASNLLALMSPDNIIEPQHFARKAHAQAYFRRYVFDGCWCVWYYSMNGV